MEMLLRPESAVFVVAVVGIVVLGVVQLVKTLLRHRERIAMIQNGMHPDAYTDEEGERSERFDQGGQGAVRNS